MTDEFLDALKKLIPEEVIDGSRLEDAARCVDLEIAYTPVLECSQEEGVIQEPVEVQRYADGRWALVFPRQHDFRFVEAETVKLLRARYLLWKGYYYRRLRTISYPDRQKVLAWYFEGGVWQPKEGTELAEKMGIY